MGGRDDHNSKNNKALGQTPKNQISDGIDIEFSEELADADDKLANARGHAASRRAKRRNNH